MCSDRCSAARPWGHPETLGRALVGRMTAPIPISFIGGKSDSRWRWVGRRGRLYFVLHLLHKAWGRQSIEQQFSPGEGQTVYLVFPKTESRKKAGGANLRPIFYLISALKTWGTCSMGSVCDLTPLSTCAPIQLPQKDTEIT